MLILAISRLIVGLEGWIGDDDGSIGASVAVTGIFAYAAHRFLLLGERLQTFCPPPAVPQRIGRFMIVTGA